MTQSTFWQSTQHSQYFAELCNALYERELDRLAKSNVTSINALTARIKSLPYYIKKTADSMTLQESPLTLDSQNASWNYKQSAKLPMAGQSEEDVIDWYKKINILPGLVIPIAVADHIVLDCVDRVELEQQRFRSNVFGWHTLVLDSIVKPHQLLKPNKQVMIAACAGHCWQEDKKKDPIIPTLRELLLSSQVNWKNFKKPIAVTIG